MIKIAICDDEKTGQKSLEGLIRNSGVFEDAEFCYFESGHALTDSYKDGNRYGFVFLDVDMPGVNGLDAGMFINETDPKAIIIFYSAYPQYAIDAFDCNAFHYIVKGVDGEKFNKVMRRAYDKHRRLNEMFVFKTKDGVANIPLSDILYIEYMKKHLIIHTQDGTFETRDSMISACDRLCGFGFYLCHQSFLVNFEKVHRIMKNDILLTNGERIMMSVRKRTDVISAYNRYIENFVL